MDEVGGTELIDVPETIIEKRGLIKARSHIMIDGS